MQKLGVTAEKIDEVLKSNESDLEAKYENNNLLLRNRDWSNLRIVNYNFIIILETYSNREYHTKEKE